MLTLDLDQFHFELKDGAVQHVGASNADASATLYDVTGVDVREYGDRRVKLAFEDDEGNDVTVALDPEQAREIARGVEMLEEDSPVFE
ncbi:hypothetical protein [Halomicrobium salinisoli]|uniref:hypothetical protein n=1 Tax=Halomicrobium salinisoli TaxID=2878391 RepID=UPI001CF057A3|nr:hypothetical protein [Halomicrobium salinisoli]